MLLHSLLNPSSISLFFCSLSPIKNPRLTSHSLPPSPPLLLLRFRTSDRENLRYLKSLGVIDVVPRTKPHKYSPSPETLTHILSTVDFLKSKGFSDPDFARLAFLCPEVFSPDFSRAQIEPVFDFLTVDVAASPEESRGLILCCPKILSSNAEFCLRPTLLYLRELGIEKLNSPSNLNAHLLNTRIDKLEEKIGFLRSIGFSDDESARACARLPAILGYSVENNMRRKFHYLVREMKRGVEEVKEFPRYFAFSLEKRIVPRHLHLKQRNNNNVEIPLPKMLLWSDKKFYAKWK